MPNKNKCSNCRQRHFPPTGKKCQRKHMTPSNLKDDAVTLSDKIVQSDNSASNVDTDCSSDEQDNVQFQILKQLKKANECLDVVEEQVAGTCKLQAEERQKSKELSRLSSKNSNNGVKQSKSKRINCVLFKVILTRKATAVSQISQCYKLLVQYKSRWMPD